MDDKEVAKLRGYKTEHGWSKDGFSAATLDALNRGRRRIRGAKRAEVIHQELIQNPEFLYHVIVRFPEN